MKKKKIILPVVIILVIALAAFFVVRFFVNKAEDENGRKVYVVSVADITGNGYYGENRYMGVVEAQESKSVEKDSEKVVKEIFVEVEDSVKKGDKLFEYDTAEMELKLKQLELELANINNNISTYNQQISTLNKEKEQVPADERIEYTSQIQSLEAQINQLNYDASSKQLEIDKQKASMEDSIVYSPMDGVIKAINDDSDGSSSYSNDYDEYDKYDDYSGGYEGGNSDSAFISIMAKGDYRIKATASEINIRSLSEDDSVIVRSRIDDNIWNGTITKVDTEHPVSNQNDYYYENGESATEYPFYVTPSSFDGLMLGQHVYVELDYGQGEVKEGLWLDKFYIVMDEDKPYVWAADSKNRIEKRYIELGEYDEELMQYKIESGLTEEDRIAYPEDFIEEGLKVTDDINEVQIDDVDTNGDSGMDEEYDGEDMDIEMYDEDEFSYDDEEAGEESFDGEEIIGGDDLDMMIEESDDSVMDDEMESDDELSQEMEE